MSSKPDAGINHKVYGVTSEGVQVFLDQLLRFAGRAPGERPFTVKITGGPDGDVAGNAIKVRRTSRSERAAGRADRREKLEKRRPLKLKRDWKNRLWYAAEVRDNWWSALPSSKCGREASDERGRAPQKERERERTGLNTEDYTDTRKSSQNRGVSRQRKKKLCD